MPREPLPPPTNTFIPPPSPEILVHPPPEIKLPDIPPPAKSKAIKVRIKKVAPPTKSKKETEGATVSKGITEETKFNEGEYSISSCLH
jgi:hypothetical protein